MTMVKVRQFYLVRLLVRFVDHFGLVETFHYNQTVM